MLRLRASAIALTLAAASAVAADDFYTPPSALSRYRNGDVIKWERVSGMTSPLNSTIARRIMYRSTDRRNRPTAVTGMLFEPGEPAPPEGWPIVSFTHGTTGVGDGCAPSKYPNLYWPEYAWLVGRLVADGFVVVATDYQGLGTPGLHPWLELDSEAFAGIDAAAAALQLVRQASGAWAVAGHSQGGHAALGVGELATLRQRRGLRFVGTVSMAPGSQLADLAPLADSPDRGWDVLAYGAASIKASDPTFDYADMLLPPLLWEMPRAEVTCVTELFRYFHTTYRTGVVGLRSDFLDSRAVADWFSRNEPGQRPSGGPILLMQGAHDTLVPAYATTALAEQLCLNGDAVDYQLLTGADHDAVIYQSYVQVRAWLRDRFGGLPAVSTCQ